MLDTALMRRLGADLPIIQAPLAGGGDTPELVAAVGMAGGFGFMGAAYLPPERILAFGRAVREKTARPFGVNLFAPAATAGTAVASAAVLRRLAPYYAELGLPAPDTTPTQVFESFDAQFAAALACGANAMSFTFGLPPAAALAAVKARGLLLIGTATNVAEAVLLEAAGVDAIVAQGAEAGGHRGTFHGSFEASLVGTIALVPQIVDAVKVPVIASGGIMDGRGLAAARMLGAQAVQMGTAFLSCPESGIAACYRAAIREAHETGTCITRAFSGRPARGLVNRFLVEMQAAEAADEVAPFPLQNALTRPLRSAAAARNRPEFLSLWAGQAARLARAEPAAALVARVAREARAALAP